jgi:hypothetical protein
MQSQQNPVFHRHSKEHFHLLFPELEPLLLSDEQIEKLAAAMLEKKDDQLGESRVISNGLAIFSQFLAHDITFESTTAFKRPSEVQQIQNDRTTSLDLDCVYGQRTQDFFYDANDKDKMLLGKRFEADGNIWYDLLRNPQGKAIIPDARNDENIIVSRMQTLFLEFHNAIVDRLRAQGRKGEVFKEAKQQVLWHYHHLIVHDYLHKMMDWEVYEDLMDNGCRYFWDSHSLPLEFTGAIFRTGHSQTRDVHRINEKTEKSLLDLGFFTEMTEFVDWRYIFDFGDGKCQYARLIDTKLGKSFHSLPFVGASKPIERSLPFRNLKRGVIYGLPSGEAVARRMGLEELEIKETKDLGLPGTPLWFYILREGELLGHAGEHLGPVGSRILGECFMGILWDDDYSYLKIHPRWTPTLGRKPGKFDFVDMIQVVEGRSNRAVIA